MRNVIKTLGQYLIIILISLLLLELILFSLYKNYSFSENIPPLKQYLRKYYASNRSIIQFNPDCAKYDKDLTYVLKEGECQFKNKEFDTKYHINSFGLRDDKNSLIAPDIIVLGDSHAMGWGSNQDQSFASLIEKQSNLKVLNAAISSYGTARQYLMLKKLDKSNLKYLIIQYCPNDYPENDLFIKNNFTLKNTKEDGYQKTVNKHLKKAHKYKPLRFSFLAIRESIRSIKGKYKKESSVNSEAEFDKLLEILLEINDIISQDTKIILFEVDGHNNNDSELFNYFKDYKIDGLTVFDASQILNDKDYFILDDHMNQNGHLKISNKIQNLIKTKN